VTHSPVWSFISELSCGSCDR